MFAKTYKLCVDDRAESSLDKADIPPRKPSGWPLDFGGARRPGPNPGQVRRSIELGLFATRFGVASCGLDLPSGGREMLIDMLKLPCFPEAVQNHKFEKNLMSGGG